MKNIFKVFIAAIILVAGCTEPDDLITGDAQEAAFLSLSGQGSLAGAPEAGVELEDASITFQSTVLEYEVSVASPNVGEVSRITTYKTLAGQTVEVASAAGSEGISLSLSTIDQFLEGFSGITASDLRVGDQVAFYSELTMSDGRIVRDRNADLFVSVSCLADLTGTYLVTNSWCSPSFTIEITQNADGSYYLPVADGGGLHTCTANTTLLNWGDIQEQCGEILPTDALRFGTGGSGNAIGDIQGGTWDAVNGVITMEHTQDFTTNWPSEWTSTYTRQ